MPMSNSAIPTMIASSATPPAKKDTYSAVVSAVSVTQIWRAGLLTGAPVSGFLEAAALSLVPLPSSVAYCGISA